MSNQTRKSGLIQTVRPFLTTGLTQMTGEGVSQKGGNVIDALKDENSRFAIPDIPAGELPYDGLVAFGVFPIDPALNGVA